MITSTICTSTILVQHSPGTTAGEGKRLAPLTPSQQKAPLRLTAPRRAGRPLEMQCVTWKCGDIQDLENKQVLHLKWKRRERAEIPRLRRRHPHGPMQQECLSPREQEGTVGRRRGTLEGPQASQREGQTVPETPA